jgi:hypothetical protein
MSSKGREQWMRDLEARQRNIVFPDTALNEARFWRNLISGKERLTTTQIVGIAVICSMLVFPFLALLKLMRDSVTIAFIIISTCIIFFALLRWRTRKNLTSIEHQPRRHRAQ